MRGIPVNEGEKVLGFYHRHVLVLAKSLILALLLLVLGIFLTTRDIRYLSFVGVVLVVVAAGKVLYEFIIWYFDIYVVTNRRVIDIDQKGLFTRHIVEAPLEKVQNISQQTNGFLETVFGYGTVVIQTAASELKFEDVGAPLAVQQAVQTAIEAGNG